VPARKAVAIEDSSAGVQAAVAAGVPCVALARPGAESGLESGAIAVVEDLVAALEVVRDLGL
jgi:beta-phosphoglucomutase-like phosphatase (HAD superfamily)